MEELLGANENLRITHLEELELCSLVLALIRPVV